MPALDLRKLRSLGESVFLRFLTANGIASLLGVAMQAASAPLLLRFLGVDDFAHWAAAVALANLGAQIINSVFYSAMNEYSAAIYRENAERAGAVRTCMNLLECILILFSFLALTIALLLRDDSDNRYIILLCLLALVNALAFSYISIDAHFRGRGMFVTGTNLLTASRIVEWSATMISAWLSRDVVIVAIVACTIKVPILVFHLFVMPFDKFNGFRAEGCRVALKEIFLGGFRIGSGQALSASLLNIPQIAIGAWGMSTATASFNVHRVYVKLGNVVTNILLAASWPVLNECYARNDWPAVRRHMTLVTGLTAIFSISSSAALLIVAPVLFPLLFGVSIPVDRGIMLPLSIAALANAVNSCALIFVTSTNAPIARLQHFIWPLAILPCVLFLVRHDLVIVAWCTAALECFSAVVCGATVWRHLGRGAGDSR